MDTQDGSESSDELESALCSDMHYFPTCCGRRAVPTGFKDVALEKQFRSQVSIKLGRSVPQVTLVVGLVWCLLLIVELVGTDYAHLSSTHILRFVCFFLEAIMIVALLVVRIPEFVLPYVWMAIAACVLLTNRSRAASILGADVSVVFPDADPCSMSSDTMLMSNLSLLVISYFLLLPVRCVVSAPMVFATPGIYFALSLPMIDRDGETSRNINLAFRFLVIIGLAFIGRIGIEKSERMAFLAVQKARKQATKEKVLRFAAEHKSDRGPFSDRRQLPPTPSQEQSREQLESEHSCARSSMNPSSAVFCPAITPHDGELLRQQLLAMEQLARQEHWHIDPADLQLEGSQSVLGTGGFGVVRRGSFVGTAVAVKLAYNKHKISFEVSGTLKNELRLLRHVRHPSLVTFYGACIIHERCMVLLVEELIDGTSLRSLVEKEGGKLKEEAKCQMLVGICAALSYLHNLQRAIVHGDLKPENVLIKVQSFEPKLVDFGLSQFHHRKRSVHGLSLRWAAPELFLNADLEPCCSVDIFSFGRVIFFVATGNLPLADLTKKQIVEVMKDGRTPALAWTAEPSTFQSCGRDLAMPCLQEDAEKRPVAEVVQAQLKSLYQSFSDVHAANAYLFVEEFAGMLRLEEHAHTVVSL